MQTLTVTTARAQLGRWMKRAAAGEDIGIICGAQIIALRPVPVVAADYAETEYGLTTAEMDRAAKNIHEETKRERAAGLLVPVPRGGLAKLVAAARRQQKGARRARRTA